MRRLIGSSSHCSNQDPEESLCKGARHWVSQARSRPPRSTPLVRQKVQGLLRCDTSPTGAADTSCRRSRLSTRLASRAFISISAENPASAAVSFSSTVVALWNALSHSGVEGVEGDFSKLCGTPATCAGPGNTIQRHANVAPTRPQNDPRLPIISRSRGPPSNVFPLSTPALDFPRDVRRKSNRRRM